MRAWIHLTKGRIVGEHISSDGTWTHVLLHEEAWADVRHHRRDLPGTQATYRTSFLTPIIDYDPEKAYGVLLDVQPGDPQPAGDS